MKMRTPSIQRMLLAAALILLTGCGTAFREPTVTLQDVRLAGIGARGGTLMVDVEVMNPNRFALSTDRLRYQLAIAQTGRDTTWFDLATGLYEEPISIGPGQTGYLRVPVEFTYTGLGGAAASIMRAGTFNYRATGSVDLRTPVGTYQVPFRRSGMVSLLGVQ
jgi:LEA14-like dessication related protein